MKNKSVGSLIYSHTDSFADACFIFLKPIIMHIAYPFSLIQIFLYIFTGTMRVSTTMYVYIYVYESISR